MLSIQDHLFSDYLMVHFLYWPYHYREVVQLFLDWHAEAHKTKNMKDIDHMGNYWVFHNSITLQIR